MLWHLRLLQKLQQSHTERPLVTKGKGGKSRPPTTQAGTSLASSQLPKQQQHCECDPRAVLVRLHANTDAFVRGHTSSRCRAQDQTILAIAAGSVGSSNKSTLTGFKKCSSLRLVCSGPKHTIQGFDSRQSVGWHICILVRACETWSPSFKGDNCVSLPSCVCGPDQPQLLCICRQP